MKHTVYTIATLALAVFATACGGEESSKTPVSEVANAPQIPAGILAENPPTNAQPLHVVRASAKQGDTIVFTGYIGGRAKPFTEGRAVFTVADSEKAPACSDGCPIPWDACCTPSDVIAANSATVQIVDEGGSLLRLGLEGVGNLRPGAEVTVTGKVREASGGLLIVDAESLFATPGS